MKTIRTEYLWQVLDKYGTVIGTGDDENKALVCALEKGIDLNGCTLYHVKFDIVVDDDFEYEYPTVLEESCITIQ